MIAVDDFSLEPAGEQATRIIRVFNNGDEDAVGAIVQSELTDQLNDVTWTRSTGVAKYVGSEFAPFQRIVSNGVNSQIALVGDVNGDDIADFGVTTDTTTAEPSVRSYYVVFGGRDDVSLSNITRNPKTVDSPVGVKLDMFSNSETFSAVGDVNGDGVDDLRVGRAILFGAESLGRGGAILLPALSGADGFELQGETPQAVGDVNSDGIDDLQTGDLIILGGPDIGGGGRVSAVDNSTTGSDVIPVVALPIPEERTVFVGDVNGDGIADYTRGLELFLGEAGPSADPSLEEPNPIEIIPTLWPAFGFGNGTHGVNAGDVNGDGIDDLLFNMHGGVSSRPGSTKDNSYIATGAHLVLGSPTIGGSGSIDVATAGFTFQMITHYYNRPSTHTEDRNGDGIQDIVMSVSEQQLVILGRPQIESIDFGMEYQHAFNGEYGYAVPIAKALPAWNPKSTVQLGESRNMAFEFRLDVADNREVVSISSKDLRFGKAAAGGSPNFAVGENEIFERVTIPAGSQLTYTATGRVIPDAKQSFDSSVATSADQTESHKRSLITIGGSDGDVVELPKPDSALLDNYVGPNTGVLLDTKISHPEFVVGEEVAIQVAIHNRGAELAEQIDVVETLSSTLQDATWSLETDELFPDEFAGSSADYGPWMSGFGTTTLSSPTSVSLGTFAGIGRAIGSLGDVNGDGFDDFFLTSNGYLRIHFGASEFGNVSADFGNFVWLSPNPVGTEWRNRKDFYRANPLGDLNGDGFDDIFVLGDEEPLGRIFYGRSDFQFEEVIDLSLHSDLLPEHSAAGDINGDGKPDLIVGNTIQLGGGEAQFRVPDSEATLLALGDVNADGFDDLAAVTTKDTGTEKIQVLFGDDQPPEPQIGRPRRWLLADQLEVELPIEGAFIQFAPDRNHDVNGDGVSDLVLYASTGEGLSAYIASGNAALGNASAVTATQILFSESFEAIPRFDGPNPVGTFAVGDINHDGFDDVAMATGGALVYFGHEENVRDQQPLKINAANFVESEINYRAYNMTVASGFDVNGDGIEDLLIGDLDEGPRSGSAPYESGAAYFLLGRSAVNESGSGSIDQPIELLPDEKIVLTIRGTVTKETLAASRSIRLATNEDQHELFPLSNTSHVESADQLLADLNADGRVDFADFLLLSNNVGKEGPTRLDGDLNDDMIVDLVDLLILQEEFGRSL